MLRAQMFKLAAALIGLWLMEMGPGACFPVASCCLTQDKALELQTELCKARGRVNTLEQLEPSSPLLLPIHMEWLKVRKNIDTWYFPC